MQKTSKLAAVVALAVGASAVAVSAASAVPDSGDPEECVNVEEAGYDGGDRQCFNTDEDGMVCGWDGEPNEAYCEIGSRGLKVCARKRGGGKCAPGSVPFTEKEHDNEPAM